MRQLVTTIVAALLACAVGCEEAYDTSPGDGTPPADTVPPGPADNGMQESPDAFPAQPAPGAGNEQSPPPTNFNPPPGDNPSPGAGAFDPPPAATDPGNDGLSDRGSEFRIGGNPEPSTEGRLELESAELGKTPDDGLPAGDASLPDAPAADDDAADLIPPQ